MNGPVLEILIGYALALQSDPAAPEADPKFSARLGASAWYVLPTGWLTITRGSKPGTATRMSVGDEFDLNREVEPAVELSARYGPHHGLGVRLWRATLSGTSVDEDSFVYHGFTFDVGRTVHAEVDFLLVDADYQYCFNPQDEIRVTGHVGAEYWSFRSRLRTTDSLVPIDTSRGFDSAFWLAGVDVRWPLWGNLDASTLLVGGTERSQQYFVEAQASLRLMVWDHVGVTLGYHFHTVHFRQSTNQSGLNLQGPQLGIEVSF